MDGSEDRAIRTSPREAPLGARLDHPTELRRRPSPTLAARADRRWGSVRAVGPASHLVRFVLAALPVVIVQAVQVAFQFGAR